MTATQQSWVRIRLCRDPRETLSILKWIVTWVGTVPYTSLCRPPRGRLRDKKYIKDLKISGKDIFKIFFDNYKKLKPIANTWIPFVHVMVPEALGVFLYFFKQVKVV
jgi:hypothetical protein